MTRIPVLLKAKVVSINEESVAGFSKMVIKLQPEEIIKGKLTFLKGNELTVYYRYYEAVPSSNDFKVGESYFLPIWDRHEPENPEFAIATWVDGHGSRFLIKDGFLHDEFNFFEMGTKIEWAEFKSTLEKIIYKIHNELRY